MAVMEVGPTELRDIFSLTEVVPNKLEFWEISGSGEIGCAFDPPMVCLSELSALMPGEGEVGAGVGVLLPLRLPFTAEE
jgi:hypothetical protein